MSGLFGTLSMAVGAMLAEQGALDATTNNVANTNTPGYSRQRPVLAQADPVNIGTLTYGTGVVLEKLESVRDPILEIRIQNETYQKGELDAFVSGMNQVQVLFTSSSNDIATQMSKFFSSIDQLSTDPANLSLRQGVLTAAGNLATTFNTAARTLTNQRQNLDLNVSESVQQVNVLTGEIAALNTQITNLTNVHESADSFIDQRTVLINQLASLVDVSSVQSGANGLTITTSQGIALVVGGDSFALSSQLDSSGVRHIFSQGADVTTKIDSGKLGGLISLRDQKLPAYLANLDTLASGFSMAVNAAQQMGFDLNGIPGTNLFAAPPAGGNGAALGMALAITDPTLVAASADANMPASNGNLHNLAAVHDQKIISGQTPTDYYSNLVFSIGSDVANASAELDASQQVLQQLNDQRNSLSGVSLNEEAANLIQYQRAYEAAARVVSTINNILDSVIHLGE